MAFYIGTEPDKVGQARDGFRTTVTALRNGLLPGDEVERAKNILTGEYYQEHQSLGSRSGEAASLLVQGFDLDHDKAIIDAAQKITPEALQDLARRWLDWDKAYELRVEP